MRLWKLHQRGKRDVHFFECQNKQNCDALWNLVPFAQLKKSEKHPWRSVNFNKVAGNSPQFSVPSP